jgi:hypothetical protein
MDHSIGGGPSHEITSYAITSYGITCCGRLTCQLPSYGKPFCRITSYRITFRGIPSCCWKCFQWRLSHRSLFRRRLGGVHFPSGPQMYIDAVAAKRSKARAGLFLRTPQRNTPKEQRQLCGQQDLPGGEQRGRNPTAKLFAYRQWCCVSCHSREAVDSRSAGGAREWGGGPPGSRNGEDV